MSEQSLNELESLNDREVEQVFDEAPNLELNHPACDFACDLTDPTEDSAVQSLDLAVDTTNSSLKNDPQSEPIVHSPQKFVTIDTRVLDRLHQQQWRYKPAPAETVQTYLSDVLTLLSQVQSDSDERSSAVLQAIAASFDAIHDSYRLLEVGEQPQEDFIEYFSKQARLLPEAVRKLWYDYRDLQAEKNEWLSERGKLLSELANLRRDRRSTYITSTSGMSAPPQHHELVQSFVQLREQNFKAIAREIFRLKSEGVPCSSAQRKAEIAQIRSVLACEILTQSRSLERTISTICQHLHLDQHWLYLLHDPLHQAIKAGFDLIHQIQTADPPGRIFTETAGSPFNPQRHESIPGCDDGNILFTVHPGYLVEDRVLAKAFVFTVSNPSQL